MGLINILKRLDGINKKINLPIPTYANIYIEDNTVYLDTNGVPHVIEIYYSGYAYITDPNVLFKTIYSKSKITLYNLFNKDVNRELLSYGGYIDIIKVVITNNTGEKFNAKIFNNENQDLINKQKTKFEDSTLRIIDEQISKTYNIRTTHRTGISKRKINQNLFNKDGKFQKISGGNKGNMIPDYKISAKTTEDARERGLTPQPAKAPVQQIRIKTKVTKDVKGGKY